MASLEDVANATDASFEAVAAQARHESVVRAIREFRERSDEFREKIENAKRVSARADELHEKERRRTISLIKKISYWIVRGLRETELELDRLKCLGEAHFENNNVKMALLAWDRMEILKNRWPVHYRGAKA